eukprot:TRINITY_DN8722_c0_g1_i3.p1 TRINITY_DN8722_c0_g1~~TRINITY_DN8722_c0_g1_i3.p1  ORF type:complete len:270 (+),score=23.12 TRINITY_DN8722_c0_g1_i3:359-1168(+)
MADKPLHAIVNMKDDDLARRTDPEGEGSRRPNIGETFSNLQRRMQEPSIWKKMAGEFIGLFVVVFAGCGSIMVNDLRGGPLGLTGIASAFGGVFVAMIYAVGHISGAHFNPAVTIAFGAFGHFPKRHVPLYVVTQCLAALAASKMLNIILGDYATMGVTLPSGSEGQAFGMEIFVSAFLMFVVTSVATDSKAVGTLAGVAIGGTILFEVLLAGPISGASMNPARSLGPCIVSGNYTSIWIYMVGPILGALVGIFCYEVIRVSRDPDEVP